MAIKRRTISKYRMICRTFTIVLFALFLLHYAASCYTSLSCAKVIVNLSSVHENIVFTYDDVYLLNGTAFDFYSLNELNHRSGIDLKWKTFPLQNEQLADNIFPWQPADHQRERKATVDVEMYEGANMGLAFVDHIYIASAPKLIDRHTNIKRTMEQYQITNYEWRMKWSRDTCYSLKNRQEVVKKMNLLSKPTVGKYKQRQCAITMEHIDIWHDVAARNFSLSLIFEDDAVFVPHFQEKFNRTIYTAIRTGAVNISRLARCARTAISQLTNSNEWLQQDPVVFIGGCMKLHDDRFRKNDHNATPMLSTHKENAHRCSHAYLLTTCSARALIQQISVQKRSFMQSDLLLSALIAGSPALQSFWLDPPIVYQGNRVRDLDNVSSFKHTTY